MVINKIIELIKENNNISIFVHEKPDPDALGSAFALYELLKHNFKNKNIKIIGLDRLEKTKTYNYFLSFYKEDIYDESFIKNSLGIIVDTANKERVLTKLNTLCKTTIRFDHHPFVEQIADYEVIDSSKSSNCQIIAEILKNNQELETNEEVAKFLYIGIIGDTNRFMYSPNSKTFEITS